MITKDAAVHDLLEFYMGKNTPKRQDFIIDNLKVEKELVEETTAATAKANVMRDIARKLDEVEEEV